MFGGDFFWKLRLKLKLCATSSMMGRNFMRMVRGIGLGVGLVLMGNSIESDSTFMFGKNIMVLFPKTMMSTI